MRFGTVGLMKKMMGWKVVCGREWKIIWISTQVSLGHCLRYRNGFRHTGESPGIDVEPEKEAQLGLQLWQKPALLVNITWCGVSRASLVRRSSRSSEVVSRSSEVGSGSGCFGDQCGTDQRLMCNEMANPHRFASTFAISPKAWLG